MSTDAVDAERKDEWDYVSFSGASLDVDGTLKSLTLPPAAAPSSETSGADATGLRAVEVGTLTLRCSEGHITFSREEARAYRLLYLVADVECAGSISRTEGLALMRRSRLPEPVLAEVWRLASGSRDADGDAHLSYDGWFVAMKLVALAQRTTPPRVELRPLLALSPPASGDAADAASDTDAPSSGAADEAFALPDFGFGSEREIGTEEEGAVERGSIAVLVGPPITVRASEGALATVGLGGSHIAYECECSTTRTDEFVRLTMRASRRFRDFVWLHDRLKEKFLDTVVPPLPAKRIVGNTDAAFLAERRQMLALFINDGARHAKLSRCAEFGAFVGASTRGMAAASELAPPLAPRAEPGYIAAMWEGARAYMVGPEATPPALLVDDAYAAVETTVARWGGEIERVENAVSAMVECDKQRAYELARVGHYAGQVALCEAVASEGDGAFFAAVAASLETMSAALSDRSDLVERELLNPVRFQSGKASAAQQVVANREQLVAELRGALRRQARAKKAYASARRYATGGQKSALAEAASESKIAAERTIGDAAEALQRITAGMKKQVAQSAEECSADLRPIARATACAMRAHAGAERARWVELKSKLVALQAQERYAAAPAPAAGGGGAAAAL